jgi:hypothetical protein
MPATVRISPSAHHSLTKMAKVTNASLQETLDRAVENERRRLLLEQTNQAYLNLRANKNAWKQWRAELRTLDSTLSDGI